MSHFDSLPPVPLTIEGSSVLHQMLRLRWAAWRNLAAADRTAILDEALHSLAAMEQTGTAAFSLLGHKGDLMLIHFRPNFEGLLEAQTAISHLRLWDYVEQTTSYLSVVELGL